VKEEGEWDGEVVRIGMYTYPNLSTVALHPVDGVRGVRRASQVLAIFVSQSTIHRP